MSGENMQMKSGKLYSCTQTDKKNNREDNRVTESSKDKKSIQRQECRIQKLEEAYKDDAMRNMGYIPYI